VVSEVCLGRVPLKTLQKDASIVQARQEPCLIKWSSAPFGDLLDHWRVRRYAGCQHNELVALHNRHIVDVIPSAPWPKELAYTIAAAAGTVEQLTELDVIKATRGAQRKNRYRIALEELQATGVLPVHAKLTAFVKKENTRMGSVVNMVQENYKDPRLIQFRKYPYTLRLATWLKPMEHRLMGLKPRGKRMAEWFPVGERLIAKGLNPKGCALLLEKVRSHFSNPVEIGWDGKRWDAHVSVNALKVEHLVYYIMSGKNRELSRLLSYQLVGSGWTRGGHKYKSVGSRRSGDQNTGIGNSLIHVMLQAIVMKRCGVKKWHCLVNGDDGVIVMEASDLHLWNPDAYAEFGFEGAVGEIARDVIMLNFVRQGLLT